MSKIYTRLTFTEREKISNGLWKGESFAEISRRIKRPECTVAREVWKNVKRKLRSYQAVMAQEKAYERKKHGRPKKIENNIKLEIYIEAKLRLEWSPEEIARRVCLEYPKDKTMRISHETIYQYLYCLPKGELKKELMKGLRQEKKGRQPRRCSL